MPASTAEPITCRVIFHGRVQGVGFRDTTSRVARNHPVTGFVRNLTDGTVELQAQGEAASVNGFISEVQSLMAANIRQADVTTLPSSETFARFEIRPTM